MNKLSDLTQGEPLPLVQREWSSFHGYILALCITVVTFDYLCTFDQEVNYVWGCPWTPALPVFYLNRYIPFLVSGLFLYLHHYRVTAAGTSCEPILQATIWLTCVASFCAHLIIILRTCALWRNNFVVVVGMSLLFMSTVITTSVFTSLQLRMMIFIPLPSWATGCLTYDGDNISLWIYITSFVSEAIVIGMTGLKALEHVRRNQKGWLSQLFKNGILYCACLLLLSLSNIIIHLSPKISWVDRQASRLPQHIFHSIFCNRVVLQILGYRYRVAQDRQGNDEGLGRMQGSNELFTTVVLDDQVKTDGDIELSTRPDTMDPASEQDSRSGGWIL